LEIWIGWAGLKARQLRNRIDFWKLHSHV